ncbi:hypothetical protein ACCUM_4344 [Candidatus Accumulibacter phosphatis]|uniref:Uncharacterized protein n=1 Tax=Candidatus Accumulibacter phosphatis TaxID=327160 RepID=A0A5S4F6P6_9PROT|nr:hypothetical protein ACCUM_4344 [Candidatus Accumulibacter phosphatis]
MRPLAAVKGRHFTPGALSWAQTGRPGGELQNCCLVWCLPRLLLQSASSRRDG